MIDNMYKNNLKNEVLLSEILTQTVANVFKNPKLSYFNALQKTISSLEEKNRVKVKDLFNQLTKEITLI
ncbi:hypothetical protein [Clostridium tarantellae]|uniref:Uncharacterized protein n=1 Tax=Clostridium tarantellae TaxID=39493 RepID=A0A6I1MH42_9CLOT|nr:hypothetical protein [Clostridium tarantellae]MPQ42856.1 hypothetical protein [Clostridium tarantellae]